MAQNPIQNICFICNKREGNNAEYPTCNTCIEKFGATFKVVLTSQINRWIHECKNILINCEMTNKEFHNFIEGIIKYLRFATNDLVNRSVKCNSEEANTAVEAERWGQTKCFYFDGKTIAKIHLLEHQQIELPILLAQLIQNYKI